VKVLIFDASTIISLAMNNMLWILKPLKKQFKGKFLISDSVKKEIIDRPLTSKKFKLEAMQVLELIEGKVIEIAKESPKYGDIEALVNSMFRANGHSIKIMHPGEIGALVLAKSLGAEALVVDERTTRMLIEGPEEVAEILSRKMHTRVEVDNKKLDKFKEWMGPMVVLRSIELGIAAYELGLLDRYVHANRKDVLDAYMWAVKLRGCSVGDHEIKDILNKI
jgi:predicted nucleic acid-binding protein